MPIGGPRQRALLAMLLCNANQVVSRDRLIDELLGDQAQDSAERMLRVQISRLRKVLAAGDSDARLIARSAGYVLRVEAGELDLDDFERQVTQGRLVLEAGDPSQAAASLRDAEALWRGRALADLEFHEFARVEVQRLEELRLGAVEELIEAELALGRHASVCAELKTLVAQCPLRERLRAQLMLALYRGGRQAEALAAYQAGRSLLVKELALEPGPELKHLERAILRHDAALQWHEREARVAAAADLTASAEGPPAPKRDSEVTPGADRARRVRWAGLAIAVAGLAVLAALAVAAAPGSSARRLTPLNAPALALVSAGEGAVRSTVALPASPTDIAAGFGSLWVSEAPTGLVARVDPQHRAIVATIPVGTRPSRVVVADGRVWVLDAASRTVSAIDPNTDTIAQTVAVGGEPTDIVASAGSLWVADHSHDTISRIDPSTGRTESVVRTRIGPTGLAAAGAVVWVANDGSGTVQRIDARTGVVTGTIRVGDAPSAIAATTAAVWVLDPLDATLSQIDPQRDAVLATLPVDGAPTSLARSGGYLWVADERDGTLHRITPGRDPATNSIRVGGRIRALAVDGGLWLAVDRTASGHRGGTLTSVNSYAVVDTIDPAASTSPNVALPQLFGLINDGLVTLDHVAGTNGTRLVPDLALSLPLPTDRGRTYTFHLRPSIHYSTGGLVKPSDVTHSFERLFELGSSGTSYYEPIIGATECLRAPSECNLSRGIASDDRADTITFHLTRPDLGFLYKLTLAYADALPASTPRPPSSDTTPRHRPVHDRSLHPEGRVAADPQPALS
jgi:YVTN family beta-propeller protein